MDDFLHKLKKVVRILLYKLEKAVRKSEGFLFPVRTE